MTTPKSPEQIIREAEMYKVVSILDAPPDWLRSSMASLLCYMAERMPEDSEKYLNHAFREGYERGIQGFRTLLIEEARKILEK